MRKVFIISTLLAVFLASCIRKEPVLSSDRTGGEIVFDTPVTSTMMKSVPGPITDFSYPEDETMGIFAVHSNEPAGTWATKGSTMYINGGEFKALSTGTWAGWDGTKRYPYYWPDNGSLIFAGYSPYRKLNDSRAETPIENVEFIASERKLKISEYTIGTYIPMSKEEIEDPDVDYKNASQSDLMFFLPPIDSDGNYIGVNNLPSCEAHFMHALSLVEFNVKVEDEFDIDRVHIGKIVLENVLHTGDFSATRLDNGEVEIKWENLYDYNLHKNLTIFEAENATNALYMSLEPRTVAQILIIPGPTHPINIHSHTHINGKIYNQEVIVTPEEVGISEWKAGRRYIYNITLGINKITFSANSEKWNDNSGGITIQ